MIFTLQLIPLGMFKLNDTLKELISLTDLFLLDIKHIVPSKSKELVRAF